MPNYNGKNVKARPLEQADPKFGKDWQEGSDKVIITFDDGHEEVVARGAVGDITPQPAQPAQPAPAPAQTASKTR